MTAITEIRIKSRYVKPDSVKELERLANEDARLKHPNVPTIYLAPRKFRDDSTNSLTSCIVAYLNIKGAFVSRLNNGGIYDRKLRKYRPGTNRKGLPDVLATFQGKSLFIEVKFGKDRLSEAQEKIRDEQEQSGGFFYVARDFTGFKDWVDNLIILS